MRGQSTGKVEKWGGSGLPRRPTSYGHAKWLVVNWQASKASETHIWGNTSENSMVTYSASSLKSGFFSFLDTLMSY